MTSAKLDHVVYLLAVVKATVVEGGDGDNDGVRGGGGGGGGDNDDVSGGGGGKMGAGVAVVAVSVLATILPTTITASSKLVSVENDYMSESLECIS